MWVRGHVFVCYTLLSLLTKILYCIRIMVAKQTLILKKAHMILKKHLQTSSKKQDKNQSVQKASGVSFDAFYW